MQSSAGVTTGGFFVCPAPPSLVGVPPQLGSSFSVSDGGGCSPQQQYCSVLDAKHRFHNESLYCFPPPSPPTLQMSTDVMDDGSVFASFNKQVGFGQAHIIPSAPYGKLTHTSSSPILNPALLSANNVTSRQVSSSPNIMTSTGSGGILVQQQQQTPYIPTPRYSFLPRGSHVLTYADGQQVLLPSGVEYSPMAHALSSSSHQGRLLNTNNNNNTTGSNSTSAQYHHHMASNIITGTSPLDGCTDWRDAVLIFKGQMASSPHLQKAFDKVVNLMHEELESSKKIATTTTEESATTANDDDANGIAKKDYEKNDVAQPKPKTDDVFQKEQQKNNKANLKKLVELNKNKKSSSEEDELDDLGSCY